MVKALSHEVRLVIHHNMKTKGRDAAFVFDTVFGGDPSKISLKHLQKLHHLLTGDNEIEMANFLIGPMN
jgi:hypothetical protein